MGLTRIVWAEVGEVQLKSVMLVFLFSLLLATALAGCGGNPSAVDPPPDPYGGAVIRVACPQSREKLTDKSVEPIGDEPAALIRAFAASWGARHGAVVEVSAYQPNSGSPPEADIWVLAPCELPRWAATGGLRPLPAQFTGRDEPYNWPGLLPLYREQLLTWDEKAYGAPLLGEAPVCCYRADWLADPARQRAFQTKTGRDLAPPATWEEFAQISELFHNGGKGPGLPKLPADDRALDRVFYAIAAPYARRAVPADEAAGARHVDEVFSFHYDLKTGLPRISGPGFQHALRLLQRLQRYRPTGVEAAPEQTFLHGQAVLCVTDAAWLATFQAEPALRDKVGVCRVPGSDRYFDYASGKERRVADPNRVPYLGGAGWLAVVPKGASSPEAAFDLLGELTGPAMGTQIALAPHWGGGPVRDVHLRRERWDTYDLNPSRTSRLREALQEELRHRALKNPVQCLRIPNEASHRAVLDAAIRDALVNEKDAAMVLKELSHKWSELDAQQGLQTLRADYRRSLGLLATLEQ
jgi:multiple sugar transport system substrate-binding protein